MAQSDIGKANYIIKFRFLEDYGHISGMSFLAETDDDALAPALSLEDTLALLDALDDVPQQPQAAASPASCGCSGASNCSTSSSSGGCSPALDDDLELLTTSELSWSESEDAGSSDLATLLFSPDAGEQDSSSSSNVATPPTTVRIPQEPVEHNKQQQQRRKRKAATAAPASHNGVNSTPGVKETGRARKNSKTEILELRGLAEELQVRLAQLKWRSSRGARTVPRKQAERDVPMWPSASDGAVALPMESSVWLETAVDEFKALQKAEELNARLKVEVKRQAGLSKTLQMLFTKKAARQVHTLESRHVLCCTVA